MTDRAFYVSCYGGEAIPMEDWRSFCRRAEAQVRQYERIYTVNWPERHSRDMAVCAIADAMYAFEQLTNGPGQVVSVSVGSVTESYQRQGGTVDTSPAAQAAELYGCLCLYADVYRGC